MLKCEQCGAQFVPAAQPQEVTSLRVLCEKCEAERRAEKARRLAAQARPVSAPMSQAAAKAGAGASAGAAAAQPVPARTPPTATAAAKPAAPAAAKPAAAVAPKRAPAKPKPKKEIHLESEVLQQKENRSMLISYIVAVVIVAVAGVVLYFALQKNARQKADAEAARLELENFKTQFDAQNVDSEAGARATLEFLDANEKIWKGSGFVGDVQSRKAKANLTLQLSQERRELVARMDKAEQALEGAATQSVQQVAELRITLREIDQKAEVVGAEFRTRVAAALGKVDRAYAERLLDEARKAAAAGSDAAADRTALAKYTTAEDEINKLLDESIKGHNEDARKLFEATYRQVIAESDALVQRSFTPAAIERLPWRDLLTADEAKNWQAGVAEGFEHRIEGGVLQLVGPSASSNADGIISIGDKDKWRDFVLELEFTLTKGEAQLLFRCPLNVNKQVEGLALATGEESKFQPGQSYSARVQFIGSDWVFAVDSPDIPVESFQIKWMQSRKGAIGVLVPTGTEIKFTRFRIKVLR